MSFIEFYTELIKIDLIKISNPKYSVDPSQNASVNRSKAMALV